MKRVFDVSLLCVTDNDELTADDIVEKICDTLDRSEQRKSASFEILDFHIVQKKLRIQHDK